MDNYPKIISIASYLEHYFVQNIDSRQLQCGASGTTSNSPYSTPSLQTAVFQLFLST